MSSPWVFEAKLELNCKNVLGECPLWDDKTNELCWIDNFYEKFWKYGIGTKQSEKYELPDRSGSFCFCQYDSNIILFAFAKDPAFFDLKTNIKCTNSICFSLNGDKMYMTDTFGWNQNPKIMEYQYFNDSRLPSNAKIYK